jgi:3-oxoacyl-[acyl-carrier protein] reductase
MQAHAFICVNALRTGLNAGRSLATLPRYRNDSVLQEERGDNMDVKGRVAVVNGASSGIGKALAIELAKLGATVAIGARRRESLDQILEEVKLYSPQSMCQRCDCTEEDQVKKMVKAVHDRYGRIDIMVNIAGIYNPKFARDMVWQDYYEDMNVGFFGALRFNQEVLPIMIKQNRGIILNMSSITEHLRPIGLSGYCATKAAVYDYSDILYKEVKGYGIHVGVIEPVLVETEMTVSGRPARTFEEISREIVQGSLESFIDLNSFIHMQAPEACAREIIREGIEKERFEVFTGEPQLWKITGFLMEMLPGLGRGMFSVMSALIAAVQGNPATSKNAQPVLGQKSGKNAVDPTKVMNTIYACSRPAARIIKELYVRLDEGANRSIYNFGKRVILK